MATRNTYVLDGHTYTLGDSLRIRGNLYWEVDRIKGGQGGVVQAIDKRGARLVAIRWLEGADSGYLQVLRRAAKNNPSFPMILDHGFHDGRSYVVTPWVEGVPLSSYLKNKDQTRYRPSASDAHRMILGLSRGISRLHEKRLVHGDIKPDNLIVKRKPLRLLLIDFGTAWTADVAKRRKRELSPKYAAPEQIFDHRLADERIDQFALGVVFYEMLTGKIPYELGGMIAGDPNPPELVPPRKLNAESWKRLDDVIARALALNPNDRFGTTRDFVRALAEAGERREGRVLSAVTEFFARVLGRAAGRQEERT
jgi:serine/threonine protein kinase